MKMDPSVYNQGLAGNSVAFAEGLTGAPVCFLGKMSRMDLIRSNKRDSVTFFVFFGSAISPNA